MKNNHSAAPLILLIVVSAFAAIRAGETSKPPPVEPPSDAEIRSTVSKGLGYLAREGEEWMAAKSCNSCHHVPELLWSHREAKQRGIAVDSKKFNQWLEWAVESAADKQPGSEESALLILAMPERPAADLTKLLLDKRESDGGWKPASQFATMQKRGEPDARASSTRLILVALAASKPESPELNAARVRAEVTLLKDEPRTSMESLVFGVLYARRFGNPEVGDVLREKIVKEQRGDGGWSSVVGENMSDPLATGQALYALQPSSSMASVSNVIARAQNWLLKTQRDDGSWPIDVTHISKVDRSAPAKAKSLKEVRALYDYWGCSWATIGLLQGIPIVEQEDGKASQ
jgi:hypothetical protein